ncbi:MAG: nickel pincer cofactor biosynthesis protein LarC [Promethearchaeota archaeon]
MPALFVDCSAAGFSGDMCLAALASLAERLHGCPFTSEDLLEKVRLVAEVVPGVRELKPRFARASKNGVSTLQFDPGLKEDQEGRNAGEFEVLLKELLERAGTSDAAARFALGALRRMLDAEASVHEEHRHEIHLHELGSADTFCDLIGAAWGFDKLGLFDPASGWTVFVGPVATGGGTAKIHHGLVPVPAPATTRLVQGTGLYCKGGPVDRELLTPTGAVLLTSLLGLPGARSVSWQPTMTVEAVGEGCGHLNVPGFFNVARLVVGALPSVEDPLPAATPSRGRWGNLERVRVLETNVDDVTGEDLGEMVTRLLEAGALDVHLVPTTTKKNRPGVLARVVAPSEPPETSDRLVGIVFATTGTLGVRQRVELRECLDRQVVEVTVKLGGRDHHFRVKVAKDASGALINAKPEFDDLRVASQETGAPPRQLRERVVQAFLERLEKKSHGEGVKPTRRAGDPAELRRNA